jgi:hypothetical protein
MRFCARKNCFLRYDGADEWHMIEATLGEGFSGRGRDLRIDNDRPAWVVPVIRWIEWDAHPQRHGAPASSELGFIDPLLRRRLSPLARMSLKVAHDCVPDLDSVRMVYASRHGELNRTTDMLEDLASGESVSPAAFSLSVLNASAGLFSIARKDTAPATAVSAAAETFGYGLLEAGLQLADRPQDPVLLVFADEPVPEAYGEADTDCAHAIGLLLGSEGGTRIAWSCSESEGTPSTEPQSRAFLRCLREDAAASWQGAGRSWSWSRLAS